MTGMNGMDMLRVGIYGGTFAPIHNGHVAAAKAFMDTVIEFANDK